MRTTTHRIDLNRYFGSKIIQRGHRYYGEDRVMYMVKHGSWLYGVVTGSYDYYTKVDLERKEMSCNCPYEGNCKHAVALILTYNNGEYIDGGEIKSALEERTKEELADLLFQAALKDYKLLKEVSRISRKEKRHKRKTENRVESEIYDRLFGDIDTYYFPRKFLNIADLVSSSNNMTILDFMRKIVKHQDEIIDLFPDEYHSYGYREDHPSEEDLYSTLETLVEEFVSSKPSKDEWEEYYLLNRKSDYELLDHDSVFLEYYKNLPERYARLILSNRNYVEYLVKCGRMKEAIKVCEDQLQKFELLQSVDKDRALRFGLKNLIPDHANEVAEYMLRLKKDEEAVLETILKDQDPSYDLLLKIENAVLEKKYMVLDVLLDKKVYNTYYLLCVRFDDDKALKKLAEFEIDDDLSLTVGKRVAKKYPDEATRILEKSMLKIARKAYSGYIADFVERYRIITEINLAYAHGLYDRLAEMYPPRTKLKHEMKEVLKRG